MADLLISVIIPLPDHRNHAGEVLASWVTGQTLAAESYEILLVSGASDASTLACLRPLLRSWDRAWMENSDEILFLNHCAAQRARGEVLLFTESHCRGHRDCLRALAEHFKDPEADAAQCYHYNVLENRFAVMEEKLEGGFFGGNDGAYWNKVRKRAFAIRKTIYEASGGFEHEYRYYSERALAATLRRQQRRVDWLPAAVVFHYNTESFDSMRPHHEDYAEGMCLYRSSRNAAEAEYDFGPLPIWENRAWWNPLHRLTVLRALTLALLQSGLKDPQVFVARVRNGIRFAGRSLSSLHLAVWLAHGKAGLARIMTQANPGSDGPAYRWYVRYWEAIVRRKHLQTILRDRRSPHIRKNPATRWEAADFSERPHFGFHGCEWHSGRSLRWTGPAAFFLLPPNSPAGSRLEVRLHEAGPTAGESKLEIWAGSRRISHFEDAESSGRTVRCPLPPTGRETSLTFICWQVLKFPGDARTLGCAIESLEVNTS